MSITKATSTEGDWFSRNSVTFSGDDLRFIFGLVWAFEAPGPYEDRSNVNQRLSNLIQGGLGGYEGCSAICKQYNIPTSIQPTS